MFVFEESLSQIRDLVEMTKRCESQLVELIVNFFKSCYEFLSVLKMEQNCYVVKKSQRFIWY